MKFRTIYRFLLPCLFIFTFASIAQAAIVIENGKMRDADEVATLPVEEHFKLGLEAQERKDWDEAVNQFRVVISSFPGTTFAMDAHYYLGIAYFNNRDFDFANDEFSAYLKEQQNPKYFEQAMEYKFRVASAFKLGARRRILGYSQLPKWASGDKLAISIYDEIIAAMPSHELAAYALSSKGEFHWTLKDYREAVECYQTLIRRFPKHELAPESYLSIIEVYLEQCEFEFQNPDLLALAQINLRRFGQDFPKEDRLQLAEDNVQRIKEIYAQGLFDTGQFYERTKKPKASILYYRNAVNQFPETKVADQCRDRLVALNAG